MALRKKYIVNVVEADIVVVILYKQMCHKDE